MVGVPRSKGCATCRRRKVACDQTKPHCLACQKRGVECEGYTRYPVVLQWTPNGLKKRQRFEEVAGPERPSREVAVVKKGPQYNGSSPLSNASSPGRIDFAVSLPPQTPLGQFILQQIQTKCYETYLPPEGQVMIDVKDTWMYTMHTLTDRGSALGPAFAALSLARVGVVVKDQDLIAQGRGQYAIALNSLKKALYNPETAFSDRTLAAMRTLSIYEILSPTYASVPQGKVHEEGMAQWCRAAGPHSIKTPFAMQLFQDVRWSIMNYSIESHKASILGSEDWLTIPWEHFDKDCLQELYDIGFDVAAFRQLADGALMSHDPVLLQQLPITCFRILEELDRWLLSSWPGRLASTWSSGEDSDTDDGQYSQHTASEMGSLLEATSMVYYWWFKLVLNETLQSLRTTTSRESSILSDDSSPGMMSAGYTSTSQYADMALASNILTLATDIVRAAPYLLADNTGWVGPQRMAFPLKNSMRVLAGARSPVVLEAQTALKQLVQRLTPTC